MVWWNEPSKPYKICWGHVSFTLRAIGITIYHWLNLPVIIVITQVLLWFNLRLFMGEKCRSPIGWFEVNEFALIGPEVVYEVVEKVRLIMDRLKTAQSRQKSYTNNWKRDLEFMVGDLVYLNISPMKEVMRFGKLSPWYVGPYDSLKRIRV